MTEISNIFDEIESATSVADLKKLIKSLNFEEELQSIENRYPKFSFKISGSDVKYLIEKRYLNQDHTINPDAVTAEIPLTKLLFSIVWKNGDLHKIQHIVDGITGENNSKSKHNLIFRQFGKYLSSDNEPIIDQHVLRAYACYSNSDKADYYRAKTVFRNTDEELAKGYTLWFKSQLSRIPDNQRTEFAGLIDRIVFNVGKKLRTM